MEIFILGANGFIGSHLCEAILTKTAWKIHAIDILQDKLMTCFQNRA
jgi:nucleoside-diphosphate-sugar epimerase